MRRMCPMIVIAALGCTQSTVPQAKLDPPVVIVGPPVEKEVQDYSDYTGRTDAVEFVDVRARVSGYLTKINFTPGTEVKKDAVLFEIDERPYQAALDKAMADIQLADAKLTQTAADVKRNEPLVRSGATTKADFDKLVADRDVAAAQKKAYEAAAAADKLNVNFCKILTPIDGRVSRNYITVGNLVTADSTLLTTIVSVDPIDVYFEVDERTVLRIQQLIREGKFKSARRHNDVGVLVGLANEPGKYPHKAMVDFVDNRIDPSTGTLRCRAELSNPIVSNGDRVFSPGLFVRVRLPLGPPHKAVLVSERAVGTDQGQKFVYVVNDKNAVVRQPVTLGQAHDGLRVVESGLTGGERVIVTGLQRVRPGIVVTPKSQAEFESASKGKGVS
ncbi:MAG: efflux RND transporter periplasmic adaptor subunit [Gemmataceae bacterium]